MDNTPFIKRRGPVTCVTYWLNVIQQIQLTAVLYGQ